MLVFVCMFCLLVVLVKLSVLCQLMARKTPLRKPKEIISTRLRLKSAYDFQFSVLFHCFIVCMSRPSGPTRYILILLWHVIACLC